MPVKESFDLLTLDGTIEAAKAAARRYRELTGKPLGITGEVGEVLAARLLGLELADARQAGYDAVGSDGRRVQIKSRCVLPKAKPGLRLGSIRLDHEWDTVALILMDQDFEPLEVYEAVRSAVKRELLRPGSKSRNERGALSVSKFKAIGELRWPCHEERPA
ncbi:hypothetical protein KAX17_10475 [Candidatus Bipolaricaulota bacterium]|nr:hypothetical protein [Candidatus Bipolaricaulota bacterium]